MNDLMIGWKLFVSTILIGKTLPRLLSMSLKSAIKYQVPEKIIVRVPIYWYKNISSTMDKARELVNQNNNKIYAVLADHQFKGRGTRGRVWLSADKNVYLTVVIPQTLIPVPLHYTPLRIGTIIASVIAAKLTSQDSVLKLKWPNDVLINSQKICGTLIEVENGNVIVGIGCNIGSTPPVDVIKAHGGRPPTCLAEHNEMIRQIMEASCHPGNDNQCKSVDEGGRVGGYDGVEGGGGDIIELDETFSFTSSDTELTIMNQDVHKQIAIEICNLINEWIGGEMNDGTIRKDSIDEVLNDFGNLMDYSVQKLRDPLPTIAVSSKSSQTTSTTPSLVEVIPLYLNRDGTLKCRNVQSKEEITLVAEYLCRLLRLAVDVMATCFACIGLNLCECAACMACKCFSGLVSASLSQVARFAHLLIVLTVFTIAIVLGKSYPSEINGYDSYSKINLSAECNSNYTDDCIYRQLIYRASFALTILFVLLAILSACSEYVNRSFWVIKFAIAICTFIGFWWGSNTFFSGWAEIARVISFFWLLTQGLLLLDLFHDIHDMLMSDSSTSESGDYIPYAVYLMLSAGAFAATVVGLVFLFQDYTGCGVGLFFTILTLVMGVITTGLSLSNWVSKGLLTPCFMFAYSVFMCWYALLSNPELSCNPTANDQDGTLNGAIIVVAVISLTIILYCIVNGTVILNIFNPEGEGVIMSYAPKGSSSPKDNKTDKELESQLTGLPVTKQPEPVEHDGDEKKDNSTEVEASSGTAHERVFYHVIMILIACYGCMILTNWGKTDGSPVSGSGSGAITGNESMWLKIVSQWVFLLLYCQVLRVAYIANSSE